MLLLPCGYRPQRGRTGQRILPSNARPPHDLGVPATAAGDAPKPALATAGRPLGKSVGKSGRPSASPAMVLFVRFAGVSGSPRRDSNPRPTDYESLTARRVRSGQLAFPPRARGSLGLQGPESGNLGESWRRRHQTALLRAGTPTAAVFGAPRLLRDTRHDERPLNWRENWREARAAAWRKTPPTECSSGTRIFQIWLYKAT